MQTYYVVQTRIYGYWEDDEYPYTTMESAMRHIHFLQTLGINLCRIIKRTEELVMQPSELIGENFS